MQGRGFGGKGKWALVSVAALVGAAAAQEALDIRDYEAADRCDADRTQARITVAGIAASRGILAVDIYGDDPDVFLRAKGRLRRVRVPAREGAGTVCMDVAPGRYAASTYHDVDGDRDLDKRWNMMPKEPFGLSNDPKLKFGWPKIAPSVFVVAEDGADLTIHLRTAD